MPMLSPNAFYVLLTSTCEFLIRWLSRGIKSVKPFLSFFTFWPFDLFPQHHHAPDAYPQSPTPPTAKPGQPTNESEAGPAAFPPKQQASTVSSLSTPTTHTPSRPTTTDAFALPPPADRRGGSRRLFAPPPLPLAPDGRCAHQGTLERALACPETPGPVGDVCSAPAPSDKFCRLLVEVKREALLWGPGLTPAHITTTT
jgi:hypothetical protein